MHLIDVKVKTLNPTPITPPRAWGIIPAMCRSFYLLPCLRLISAVGANKPSLAVDLLLGGKAIDSTYFVERYIHTPSLLRTSPFH